MHARECRQPFYRSIAVVYRYLGANMNNTDRPWLSRKIAVGVVSLLHAIFLTLPLIFAEISGIWSKSVTNRLPQAFQSTFHLESRDLLIQFFNFLPG